MGSSARSFRHLALAWIALAAVTSLLGGPVVVGHPSSDAECIPALSELHDHAAHRVRQAQAPGADHCIACHLTRSASGASLATAGSPAPSAGAAAVASVLDSPRHVAPRTASPRGPPSQR